MHLQKWKWLQCGSHFLDFSISLVLGPGCTQGKQPRRFSRRPLRDVGRMFPIGPILNKIVEVIEQRTGTVADRFENDGNS